MGLRVPIVNAPMGGVAGGRLAAGVSAAGGLGMVGMGTAGSVASLHTELPHVAGTFGIGLVDWVMRKEAGLFDAALAARPVLISVSFGTDLSWVSRVHDAGIAAATQVYNGDEARRARPRRSDDRHTPAARRGTRGCGSAGPGGRRYRLGAQPRRGTRGGGERSVAGHLPIGIDRFAHQRRRS
jgi:nitronate monooxygenase